MTARFAPRHEALWAWFEALERAVYARPRVEIWPRGGAKSSTVELACARLAARQPLPRRFVLYVSATQALADAHLQTIGGLLERLGIERAVNKYNHSKGWTQQRLRTAHGFNVVSFGLDAAQRGIKLDQYRPDLIILDDIDEKHDSPAATLKKIQTLTTSILPAGSTDCAIVFIQNKILPDGVAAKLANGTADFLYDREAVTEEPAVIGLTYELRPQHDGTTRYAVTGGVPTWEGQSLTICEQQINKWGLTAFLQEAQHDVDDPVDGLFGTVVFRHCTWEALPQLEDIAVWCDPAVTNTDKSDSHAIQVDARGVDRTLYRLWSWERRASPLETLCRALLKAVELRASRVGVETDQGGDTWQSVYDQAWRALTTGFADVGGEAFGDLRKEQRALTELAAAAAALGITKTTRKPKFVSAKAGAGHGPKAERGERMKASYERGTVVHVLGTHEVLERALRRYLVRKPYDLVDAAYWGWNDLAVDERKLPRGNAAGLMTGTKGWGV